MITPDMPMTEGLVYVYNHATGPLPSYDRYWRVPDMVWALDSDGRFSIELAAGDYYIGAIKRNGPPQIGPPMGGDLFLLSSDDAGMPKKVAVASGKKIDMGIISGTRTAPGQPLPQGITSVTGVVQNHAGSPIEGMLVLAFRSPRVIGKPLFVSERSGKDGRFLLRVNQGGTYYLKLRDSYGGGPPKTGETLDGNREEPMVPVLVATGENLGDVVIKGKTFPGRGRTKEKIAEKELEPTKRNKLKPQ